MASVLIVDDHPAVRAGLRALLEVVDEIDSITVAAGGHEAAGLVKDDPPDLAIVDYHMPGEDGLRVCLRLRESAPHARVAIYSGFVDSVVGILAPIAGAHAVVSKTAAPDAVVTIVRTLLAGGVVRPVPEPAAMAAVAEGVEPDDLPIVSMLLHDTPPDDVARTLGITPEWLLARRWAILRRFARRRFGEPEPAPSF